MSPTVLPNVRSLVPEWHHRGPHEKMLLEGVLCHLAKTSVQQGLHVNMMDEE